MRITGIRVSNWMRFRGDQVLELGPGVHALTSEHDDDPARSNWGGKSSFVAVIRFALFGTVPTATLDDAIHYGEDELGVDLESDDGVFITRTKKRGRQSVQTIATFPDPLGEAGEVELTQDAAQERIIEWLRLSEDDFLATSFFEQRETARFVRATPADRTEIVNGWLKLGPLEDAASHAGGVLTNALEDRAGLVQERVDLENELRATECETFDAAIGVAESLLAEVKAEHDARGAAVEAWMGRSNEAAEARGRRDADEREQARYADANSRLKGLFEEKAVVEAELVEVVATEALENRVGAAREAYGLARADCVAKAKLERGEFDGVCPVNGGSCPVTDEMNDDAEQARGACREAAATERGRQGELDDAVVALRTANEENRGAERRADSLSRLGDRIDDLTRTAVAATAGARRADAAGPVPDPEPRPPAPDGTTVGRVEARLVRLRAAARRHVEVVAEWEAADLRVATWRTASAILGRGGAQRRVAEGSLRAIERAACSRLADAGIPLTVRCQWGRETKTLEKECRSCGTPFAQRSKACGKCGAERRHKTDDKLHLVLSDRSGAAEDLAGLAFQLAAARWLRSRRGSPWSVVVLDEPFGALDEHNRRALASSLTGLLGDGFEQAFVVAHDRSTLDALPNRIRVVAHAEHSTLELA